MLKKFKMRPAKTSGQSKKAKLFVQTLGERINPVITGKYNKDASSFWYEIKGDTTANTDIGLSSETFVAGSGIRIVGVDDAVAPNTGNLNVVLQDSDIQALELAYGVPFSGVRITLGSGNDVVNATNSPLTGFNDLGPVTSMPFHQVNVVDAGAGNDTLIGGGRNDTLNGGSGRDLIWGMNGRDEMNGGAGNDSIVADYQDFQAPGPAITGDGDTDILWMDAVPAFALPLATFAVPPTIPAIPSAPGNAKYTNVDFESVIGGNGNDTVDSSPYAGPAGGVYFDGMDGNDSFVGSTGKDTVIGGDGNDTLVGGDGNDAIGGGDGNDSMVGGNGNDTLVGGNGNDSAQGGNGADSMVGGDGADWLDYQTDTSGVFVALGNSPAFQNIALGFGEANGDLIDFPGTPPTFENVIGGSGNDFLLGNNLIDTNAGKGGAQGQTGLTYVTAADLNGNILVGGAGVDQIYGQNGEDSIFGGSDNDTLYGNHGDDYMAGGTENDLMYGGDGNDVMDGGAGDDDMQGDNHDDTLYGDEPTRTRVSGVLNNRTVPGGVATNSFSSKMSGPNYGLKAAVVANGNDTMQGGNGADTLDVGGGTNIADGGLGNDRFILYASPTSDYGTSLDAAMTSLGNQYWGGAGPDTFLAIHAWDIYQLTNGPAGFTVQVNNTFRTQAIVNYLNTLQNAAPTQTDYDAPTDTLVFDQILV